MIIHSSKVVRLDVILPELHLQLSLEMIGLVNKLLVDGRNESSSIRCNSAKKMSQRIGSSNVMCRHSLDLTWCDEGQLGSNKQVVEMTSNKTQPLFPSFLSFYRFLAKNDFIHFSEQLTKPTMTNQFNDT